MLRPGGGEEKRKRVRRAYRMLVLVTQIGICMMVPIFLCVFLGQWISRQTGHLLLFPLLLLLGILAGFRTSWQMIARFTGLKEIGKGSNLPAGPDSPAGDRDPDAAGPSDIAGEDPRQEDSESEWENA